MMSLRKRPAVDGEKQMKFQDEEKETCRDRRELSAIAVGAEGIA
jgi:hypothetical protein